MKSFLVVTCRLPAEQEERLTEVLASLPVLGCQVEDAGPDIVTLVFLESDRSETLAALTAELLLLGGREIASGPFADRDWLAEYRQHAQPIAIGQRLWLDPNPAAPTPPPDQRHHLLVEPRQAFGTGSHESTRLVLEILETLNLCRTRVLDVGCGSGILALAACALGAEQALGFDIDSGAVFIARQTLLVQPRRYPVRLFAGTVDSLRTHAKFDFILANLIPVEVTPLLPSLATHLAAGGHLVLSGLMADQRQAMEGELKECDLQVVKVFECGEWVALECVPT